MSKIKGKVWKFGDNVNTDVMAPGFAYNLPWEQLRKMILHIHPKFTQEVRPGDVIVAGRNWGCGSSREQAPANLKRLGLACVVAESFGRIYFRNSVALAFPCMACVGVAEAFDEGDELELDLENAIVKNATNGRELKGEVVSNEVLSLILKGGIIPALKEKMGRKR
jgi:3-isopropylmalate/(R)-2-methylmalate dehydratase small subunit